MIHAVIFDCFGVLVHGSLDYLRSITPPEHLDELNNLSHSSDYGYVSHDDYLSGVGELTGHTGSEIADIINAQYIRNEQVIDLARSLRGSYQVGLLSNVGRGVIEKLFSTEELDELFDTVILSSEVGMVKPNPEIFQLAAQRLGHAMEVCLMIDDSPSNIAGARSVGMSGVVCLDPAECVSSVRALLEGHHA